MKRKFLFYISIFCKNITLCLCFILTVYPNLHL